jgi:DNA polymerase-3 subunit gamma/tau
VRTGAGASPVAGILAKIKAGDTAPQAEAVATPASGPVAVEPQPAANDDTDEIPWSDTEGVSETGSLVEPRADAQVAPAEVASPDTVPEPVPVPVEDETLSVPSTPDTGTGAGGPLQPENWEATLEALGLAGVTRTLAANCVIGSADDAGCVLVLNEHHASLWNKTHEARIGKALTKLLGRDIKLRIEVGVTDSETPAQAQERRAREQREQAIDAIENDANVQRLIETFDGKLNVDSIVPRSRAGE